MKKAVLMIGVMASLLAAGGFGVRAAEVVSRQDALTEETACDFAYRDAGVSEEEVTHTHAEFDFEYGRSVYEIEFFTAEAEYDYVVDAQTGEILKQEKERLPYAAADGKKNGTSAGEAEKKTAIQKQPKQSPEKNPEIRQEKKTKERESVRRFLRRLGAKMKQKAGAAEAAAQPAPAPASAPEEKAAPTPAPQAAPAPAATPAPAAETPAPAAASAPAAAPADIGIEGAKAVALSHAGKTGAEVSFLKAKRDYDDGMAVYEIEFFVPGGAEYEYEIDAATGAVREWDYDDDFDEWDD